MSGAGKNIRKAKIAAAGLALSALLGDSAPLRPPLARFYRNPVLFADYSDPDVIRVGADYYLIASSFHFVPGIPILRSTDLVHWTSVGHVVSRMTMDPRYSMIGGNRYGGGVWAPAIRRHNGLFYVYFPTPKEGIFVSTARNFGGPFRLTELGCRITREYEYHGYGGNRRDRNKTEISGYRPTPKIPWHGVAVSWKSKHKPCAHTG